MANWLITSAVVVAVLLAVLWPVRSSGVNLLRRWGIAEPRPDQVEHAVGYLKRRRLLYVLLYVVLAALLDGRDDGTGGPVTFFVPLLVAMLLAELFAVVRPVRGPRVASLDPRGWRDLIPRWAVAVGAVLVLLVVVLSAFGLAAQPWADRYAAALPPDGVPQPPTDWQIEVSDDYRAEMTSTTSWTALAGAAACLVLVVLLVHLAVRRPAVPDEAVDAALRTRTARVAVAIGFGWLGAAVMVAGHRIRFLDHLDAPMLPEGVTPPAPDWLVEGIGSWVETGVLVVQLAAIGCWVLLAMPTRRTVPAAG